MNFGLSPDFSVQLKVSLSKRLSERLSQKLKSPNRALKSRVFTLPVKEMEAIFKR